MAQVEAVKDAKKIVVDLTMTVEEARNTIWRGRGNREPIGRRLDEGSLDNGDLAWALDTFKKDDPRLSEAARTLLAFRLGVASTNDVSRFGPEVISGGRFSEEKEMEGLLRMGYLLGIATMGVIILIYGTIVDFLKGEPFRLPLLYAAATLLAIGTILWVGRKIWKELAQYRNFRRGREGESLVVEMFRRVLDNRWIIFRNLQLPDRKDDIDIALVGPEGVWAIEVKTPRGTMKVENDFWQIQKKNGWTTLQNNPSKQSKGNALRLNNFLQTKALNLWVNPAVILAEDQPIGNFKKSDPPVWILPQIENGQVNFVGRKVPDQKQVEQIATILKTLALQNSK